MRTTSKAPLGVGVVIDRRYGTATIRGYVIGEGGTVRRVEEYRHKDGTLIDGRPTVVEHVAAARVGDVSPHVEMYDPDGLSPRRYDAACACCYLHISHTVDRHDRYLGKVSP